AGNAPLTPASPSGPPPVSVAGPTPSALGVLSAASAAAASTRAATALTRVAAASTRVAAAATGVTGGTGRARRPHPLAPPTGARRAVDSKPRQAFGAPCPGTDPAALRLITAAVLAGLVISGIVVISHHGQAPGGAARFSRVGAQALAGPHAASGTPLTAMPPARFGLAPTLALAAGRPTAETALGLLGQAPVASRTVAYQP